MSKPVNRSRKPRLYIDAASFDPHKIHKNGRAVIVVVQNAEATIGKWVQEQLMNASGVVVLDKGSSDATAHLAAEAGAIVVLQEQGVGEEEVLCRAIELAHKFSENVVLFEINSQG